MTLDIGGLGDKYKTPFATVIHPRGNISVELARYGLALPSDWSLGFTSHSNASAIHAAIQQAKSQRIRLWKNYQPPAIPGEKVYAGVVAEVVSGDTVVVRVGSPELLQNAPWECEERRVSLSSIRAPKRGYRDEADEPFAYESKEFLRSKTIGKRCQVSIEYVVEPQTTNTERKTPATARRFGTVHVLTKKNKVNAAVMMLEEGLAGLMSHKANSERSQYYHELMEAEKRAKEQRKGKWSISTSPEDSGASRKSAVIDLSTPAMAKSYLTTLQDSKGPLIGIVDYIHNGARMKVYIPKFNVLVNFALAGVSAPNVGRPGASKDDGKGSNAFQAQPYGAEALALSRATVLQRQVELEVETMDRGGTAIGSMFIKIGNQRENLALILLRLGLAKTVYFSANLAKHKDILFSTEEEAKRAKLRIWKDYTEEPEQEESKAPSKSKLEGMSVSVCDVVNGSTLFLTKRSSANLLETINTSLTALGEEFGTTPQDSNGIMEPKKGQPCVALFNDGSGAKWYRAKILDVVQGGTEQKLHLRYIDFGNEEVVPKTRVRKAKDPSLFSIEPLAIEARLAFIDVPGLDEDYGREAAVYLSQLCMGKELEAKIHGKDEAGRLNVTLVQADKKTVTINGLLLREGLATVSRKLRVWKDEEAKIVEALKEDQEVAHKAHLNLWVYGDPREDDDDARF